MRIEELRASYEQSLQEAVDRNDVYAMTHTLDEMTVSDVTAVIERMNPRDRAVVYRLLSKDRAAQVFDALDAELRGELVNGLTDKEVTAVLDELDPDDAVELLDELPAGVASKMLRTLDRSQRELTAIVLGYPRGSVGRRMSPQLIHVLETASAAEVMEHVRARSKDSETLYTIPVLTADRIVTGVVSLRDVIEAAPDTLVRDFMVKPEMVHARTPIETAARRCAEAKVLAMPVVDSEQRLVGIFTIDDALTVLEDEESEDLARMSGSEPLRRPYMSTSIITLMRSRIIWLLVLAIGATLTVQVLEVFEATLSQMLVLSVFVPLLIGTGGNTGNQAATTVTRALALGDVSPRDSFKVIGREFLVGLMLGLSLGTLGFLLTTAVYDFHIGLVIGLTLVCVCTMAATVGGVMPMAAQALRADPAVFSNPFITTFVDASGLLIYFGIAKLLLEI